MKTSAEGSDQPLGASLSALVEVMRRLLAPDGCPWDREQSVTTLKPYLIEETYEVLDAIESGDTREHCEELGDLLLQIVFQAALRQAEGAFTIDDVVTSITDKLVRRHPHVFAEASAETAGQVEVQWDAIKRAEKQAKGSSGDGPPRVLHGVPVAMPALARAQKLGERAARVGFDWPDATGCADKVAEEFGEVKEALEHHAASRGDGESSPLFHELGDLLFAVVNLCRKTGFDAETALRAGNRRFTTRFGYIEDRLRERGTTPGDVSMAELDTLWNEAKTES